uniref:RNA polymerase II associated protein 1 n=1 Tax=Varanus komodoensis TaxID=61221 RepID=A0A8D2KXG8_VARKO
IMLSRPKPGESEADLLRFQDQFLAAKSSPAVKIVKKANKKREHVANEGDDERPPLQESRDVVALDGFPDVLPPLTPAPPKKSKLRSARVHFDEDPGKQLDHGDEHITAVLSQIIERDTSMASVAAPLFTGDPFPRVFHRSEIKAEVREAHTYCPAFSLPFYFNSLSVLCSVLDFNVICRRSILWINISQCSLIVTGEGLGGLAGKQEALNIHKENVEKLQSMTEEQILEEQKRLLAQLDPGVVAFLKSRHGATSTTSEEEEKMEKEIPRKLVHLEAGPLAQHEVEETLKEPFVHEPNAEEESDIEDFKKTEANSDLPVKPQKEWLHMDSVEFEKLEWMKDLPQPRQKKTKKGMQARFSLKGELIPPDKDLPTHLGLHHHGEEAERAGYSLQELFHLSRSQVIQQRTLALQVLGHIVQKAKAGEFASLLKRSVLQVLLDAGFLFLLRFSLDDPVENVIAAAVHALHALLVSADDEYYLDKTFSWYQGMFVHPFIPNKEEEEEMEDEDEGTEQTLIQKTLERKSKDDNKPDPEVARYDVVKGLLKTRILHRMRYILEVMQPVPLVVLEILDILIHVARHSTEASCQVLDCPRLIETVTREFLPIQWNPKVAEPGQLLTSLHGVPCATAMKLIRVLASGGRNVAARLLNKFDMKSRLSRFIAEDPKDLPLRKEEAIKMNTEAFRLWAVAAGYGQACDLYRDLYPVLMKMVQSLTRLASSAQEKNPTFELSIQRATAMMTLLTQVTQTAGCRAELQAQFSRYESDQIPLPAVTWSQVSGFQPIVESNLKSCLKEISQADAWEALQPLASAYLLYMGVFYSNCSQQPSVNPVDCLEEIEDLTSAMLLPLLSQPAIQALWEKLMPCSALCNPLSCSPAPETLPSIISLGCTGGKPPMSLAGSKSPFPFLTAILVLVNSSIHIHKGLLGKVSTGLKYYLLQSQTAGSCSLTPSSVWLLRHEYHFQYFVLAIAQKMVGTCSDYSQHASCHHLVAMALLNRLLPGSEHLAHELLLGLAFNPKLIPEGKAGGPEAADFSDLLHLTAISPLPTRGALLEEAYQHLPLIQACYLSHFVYLEPALVRSRNIYQGQTHLIQSMLLPAVRGPILPSDWPFLPLINLYNKVTGAEMQWAVPTCLPVDLVNTVTRNLQLVLLLETWRAKALQDISAAAKLARLMCVFLTGSDLFLEGPVHCYTAALLSLYCHSKVQASLNLDAPLPGLASFHDLYINLLEQFEGVSFGDPLFGAFVLLPLQRRFSVQLRLAVFGEHVSTLRALGVPLKEFSLPLEQYLSPPEDNLNLLRQYFQTLVTGVLRQKWCPVLYVVAVAHVNSFIFSQDSTTQEVDAARKTLLQKTWLLADEALKRHLLYYKCPNKDSPVGFDLYEQLPAIRLKYLGWLERHSKQNGMFSV